MSILFADSNAVYIRTYTSLFTANVLDKMLQYALLFHAIPLSLSQTPSLHPPLILHQALGY
jgi:hypothetical protein